MKYIFTIPTFNTLTSLWRNNQANAVRSDVYYTLSTHIAPRIIKKKNEKRIGPGVNKEFALKSVLHNIITFPAMLSSMIKGKKNSIYSAKHKYG